MNTSARPEPFDFASLRSGQGCAPALTMARFDSGRFAAYAQRERKRYGAESKGEGERFVGIFALTRIACAGSTRPDPRVRCLSLARTMLALDILTQPAERMLQR